MTGEELKMNRKSKGWTQVELGNMIGVTPGTIINYEKGRPIPDTKLSLLNKIFEGTGAEVGIFESLGTVFRQEYLTMAQSQEDPYKFLLDSIMSRIPPIHIVNYMERNRERFSDSLRESSLLIENSIRDREISEIRKEIKEIKAKMDN